MGARVIERYLLLAIKLTLFALNKAGREFNINLGDAILTAYSFDEAIELIGNCLEVEMEKNIKYKFY